MTNALLRVNGADRWMWCPGCDDVHRVTDRWTWNGSATAPTFSPSILVTGGGDDRRCHSFVTDGVWQFLADSTHALASRSVPMVPLPDWLAAEGR